ncbi:MAG TPA: aminotransferase class V-fold PLP-dependent enzyme [Planctomycetota bacterium]|nr:aminotransferase class V-fold PLP-dependent enzyme [Planctomycetota bacterium]
MKPTRRDFLAAAAAPLVAPSLRGGGADLLASALAAAGGRSPASLAEDDGFWFAVQQAFSIDRSLLNFNHGGTCPSPTVVVEAQKRHLDFSNHAPTKQMWGVLGPQIETVRERLARDLAVSTEEIALVRNATEALEICQLGIELARGDEVVTTTHDYPSMVTTWRQREKREGIVLKQVSFAPPATHDQVFERVASAVGPKTKVIHVCHITNLTGQIFPVRRICSFARERGIQVVVDGAHAYGQFPFTLPDLDCDYYGTSLHKWILAPIGTGMLYVRKSKIASLWPLFGNAEPRSDDIKKFETYGTHPYAPKCATAEALAFHQGIGAERKTARLRFLRERWTSRVRGRDGVKLYTSDDPSTSAAIGTVGFRGVDPARVAEHLLSRHRIIVAPISNDEVRGIRITPNVCTTLEEVDLLADALVDVADKGLPDKPDLK